MIKTVRPLRATIGTTVPSTLSLFTSLRASTLESVHHASEYLLNVLAAGLEELANEIDVDTALRS